MRDSVKYKKRGGAYQSLRDTYNGREDIEHEDSLEDFFCAENESDRITNRGDVREIVLCCGEQTLRMLLIYNFRAGQNTDVTNL